jgi:membrane protein implicated in regulation of membrane protease activity
MSLKAFHIFFIALSIILSAGCAVWAFANGIEPVFGISSAVVAVVLIIYGRYFLKKAKSIIT